MPKFTFKNVELNYRIFKGGSNNFDGKYTPLDRNTTSISNDRLDGGRGASSSSGFSLYGEDISKTTEGMTHTVNANTKITAPEWAKGITIQGIGGGGGGGSGGGNTAAWYYGDNKSRGGTGGAGGKGGFGYLRRNVSVGDSIEFIPGNGGAGGAAVSNSSSPNNNIHAGNPGKAGGKGNASNVIIQSTPYNVGNGGNGGNGGKGGNRVEDAWAGQESGGSSGNIGNSGPGETSGWNNTTLISIYNSAPGGTSKSSGDSGWRGNNNNNSGQYYGTSNPGSDGNYGRITYRWNTSTVSYYHNY